jgi:hypothetical protein
MLREGSKVKVIFTGFGGSAFTPGVYTVQRNSAGQLGIDYNRTRSPYMGDEEVIPFCNFAPSVLFLNVKTEVSYYYDIVKENLVRSDW